MRKILLILVVCMCLCSCTNTDQSFGISSYYPQFWWSNADTTYAEKTLVLDFSEDAIADNSYAVLEFTDLDHNKLDNNDVQIMVENIFVENCFKVKAKNGANPQEIRLKIRFLPNANEGKQFGFLRIKNHNLDRVDETMLTGKESADVFKWEIDFQKKMNPLLKTLLIISLIIISSLLIWFILLKKIFYPVFPRFRKQVRIGMTGIQTVVFTGCREVHFTNTKINQKFLIKLFKGKVLYINSPEFTSNIVFKPYKKKARAIYKSEVYRFSNNPVPKDGITEIKNNQTKNTITLN